MQCPMCNERRAAPQYYRVNEVTEQVEHLCRACWIMLRKSERDDWRYFRGAARLILLYTVLPVGIAAILVWLLASWIL
jgi:hypothetical protein